MAALEYYQTSAQTQLGNQNQQVAQYPNSMVNQIPPFGNTSYPNNRYSNSAPFGQDQNNNASMPQNMTQQFNPYSNLPPPMNNPGVLSYQNSPSIGNPAIPNPQVSAPQPITGFGVPQNSSFSSMRQPNLMNPTSQPSPFNQLMDPTIQQNGLYGQGPRSMNQQYPQQMTPQFMRPEGLGTKMLSPIGTQNDIGINPNGMRGMSESRPNMSNSSNHMISSINEISIRQQISTNTLQGHDEHGIIAMIRSLTQLVSEYAEAHDDEESEEYQQPKLHRYIHHIAHLSQRVLQLQPENVGAQRLYADFSSALGSRFRRYDSWESEDHEETTDRLQGYAKTWSDEDQEGEDERDVDEDEDENEDGDYEEDPSQRNLDEDYQHENHVQYSKDDYNQDENASNYHDDWDEQAQYSNTGKYSNDQQNWNSNTDNNNQDWDPDEADYDDTGNEYHDWYQDGYNEELHR